MIEVKQMMNYYLITHWKLSNSNDNAITNLNCHDPSPESIPCLHQFEIFHSMLGEMRCSRETRQTTPDHQEAAEVLRCLQPVRRQPRGHVVVHGRRHGQLVQVSIIGDDVDGVHVGIEVQFTLGLLVEDLSHLTDFVIDRHMIRVDNEYENDSK